MCMLLVQSPWLQEGTILAQAMAACFSCESRAVPRLEVAVSRKKVFQSRFLCKRSAAVHNYPQAPVLLALKAPGCERKPLRSCNSCSCKAVFDSHFHLHECGTVDAVRCFSQCP